MQYSFDVTFYIFCKIFKTIFCSDIRNFPALHRKYSHFFSAKFQISHKNIFQWINILSVFSWNYLDLFIILISIGLSTRFQQINMRLKKSSKTVLKENFWSEIRVHYFSLCDLVDYMDSQISSLVLVSTGHNMFSLCANIFYSFS